MLSKEAKIIFENDPLITKNEAMRQFVESSSVTVNPLPFEHEGKLVVVVKVEESEKESYETVRMTAGSISKELRKRSIESVTIHESNLTDEFPALDKGSVVTSFVEGWHLGSYQFLKYKSGNEPFNTKLQVEGDETTATYVKAGEIRAEATAFARDLTNEIPSTLNPETFPEILKEAFQDTDVKVTVLKKDDLEKRQMNGLLTVGRGSTHSPSFVELEYRKDESKPLVTLVGKGVTFDTGGISLKRGRDLSSMRMDMGGAAAVSGAMKLLADSGANVNVVALIPIAENMPDNTSLIPGDVIHYKNGLKIQVGNTDAEGRLILADALIRAGELNSDYVIDIATLTGAIVNALGTKIAGVFGDEQLAQEMKKSVGKMAISYGQCHLSMNMKTT